MVIFFFSRRSWEGEFIYLPLFEYLFFDSTLRYFFFFFFVFLLLQRNLDERWINKYILWRGMGNYLTSIPRHYEKMGLKVKQILHGGDSGLENFSA